MSGILSMVRFGGPDECWPFTGKGRKGRKLEYGGVRYLGKWEMAHRAAYDVLRGTLPPVLHHTCPNKLCCNPAHMIGKESQAEHIHEPGHAAAVNAGKTHCPNGHEYTARNTYVNNGSRSCRECTYERHRKNRGYKGKLPRRTGGV